MSFADLRFFGQQRVPTTLYMWGDNTYGQLGDNKTPSYFSWTKISSGGLHTVAIRSDGVLFAWGRNNEGQLGDGTTVNRSSPVQIGTSSWQIVGAGLSHSAAIKGDNTLWLWGNNRYGQLGTNDVANRSSPVQVSTSSWTSVDAGGNHTVGIKIDSTTHAWGFNGSGQLGDNTITNRSSPTQVGTSQSVLTNSTAYSVLFAAASTYVQQSGGQPVNNLSSGTTGDYTVEAWVYLNATPVGTTYNSGTFAIVVAGNGISSINAIYSITVSGYLVMTRDGVTYVNITATIPSLYTWSHIAFVNVGTTITVYLNGVSVGTGSSTGTWSTANTFVGIGGQTPATSINGYISNCRLTASQALYTSNFTVTTSPLTTTSQGAIATNVTLLTAQSSTYIDNSTYLRTLAPAGTISISVNTPFAIYSPGAIFSSQISAGKTHSVAITTTNQLYAWGDNTYGELGDSTLINRSSPVQIGTGSWSLISAGGSHTAAIESDGSLMTWGLNSSGQLGLNSSYSGYYWTSVSEGATHTLAIRNDGGLFAWGRNNLGQLGTGDTGDRSSPIQIGSSSWTIAEAGGSHSMAIRSDGTLFAWGTNIYGQLGNNPSTVNVTWSKIVTASTGSHFLAIKNDGTLWAWGQQSTEGRLGDGSNATKSSPIQIGALNTWIDVAAGQNHSMGITNDNVLYTWGSSTFGQIGDGTAAAKNSPLVVGTNFKKVFAGFNTALAIDNNNLAYIWGDNSNGLIPGGIVGTHRSSIALLNTDNNWSSFAVDQHILGIKTDGSLWTWGLNNAGQLGLGDTINRSSPVQIGTSSWIAVGTGLSFSGGITSTNSVFTWGLNAQGQLGLSDVTNRSSPVSVGAPSALTDNKAYSLSFNGSGQYLTVSSATFLNLGTGDFTIECWIYTSDYYNATTYAGIFDSRIAANNYAGGISLYYQASSTNLVVRIAQTNIITTPVTNTPLSTWNHVAIVRSGSTVTLYVNGSSVGTATNSTNLSFTSYWIGRTFDPYYFKGNISNFRIVKAAVYSSNFTVSSIPLTAIANTSLLTAQNTTVVDNSGNNLTITNTGGIASSINTPFTSAIASNSTVANNLQLGGAHVLILGTTGALYSWGLNSNGQLGQTDSITRSSPVQIGTSAYNYIYAGSSHTAAIRIDNATFTWGNNTNGQLGDNSAITKSSPVQIGTISPNYSSPVQVGTSSWIAVSAGENHSLGIGSDGVLYAWGRNESGQVGGTAGVLGVAWSKVVIGPAHSLGIRFDGKLYAWGNNASGQLGDGTTVTTAKSSPVLIDAINTYNDVTVGQGSLYYSMAIRSDGKLFAWGNNTVGQLGVYSWRQISSGIGHSLLLRSDGILYAMGTNTAGQLGDATTVNKSSPVTVGSSNWSAISAGTSVSAAIDTNGRLFTWGYNNNGQLGIATTSNRSSPVQVSTGSWSQIASKDYMLALNTQGALWSWGNNNNGQLGIGTIVNSKVPQLLDGTTTTYSVGFDGSGDYLTVPANSAFQFSGDFTIEGWMYFNNVSLATPQCLVGMVSAGNWFDVRWFTSRWQVSLNGISGTDIGNTFPPTNSTWIHVACVRSGSSIKLYINGISTGTTLTSSSTLGFNTVVLGIGADGAATPANQLFGYISNLRIVNGQALYTDIFTPSTSPLTTTSVGSTGAGAVASITGTVSLLTAQNATNIDNSSNSFTITSTGTPTITEFNPFSVITSTSSTSWSSISAGTNSLAIRNDGKLYSWGQNIYGQIGDSTTTNRSSPVQVGSSSWSLISSSATGHNLAVTNDGKLFAWGRNTSGELGTNTDFNNLSSPVQVMSGYSFTAISTGNNNSLATSTTNNINTVYGWGINDYNQLNTLSPFTWIGVNNGNGGIQVTTGNTVGRLYLWGNNSNGQLGLGDTVSRSSPTQVGGITGATNFKTVSTNTLNTAYITSDSKLFVMGDNTYGQLGQSDTVSRSSPVQVGSDSWTSVSVAQTGHILGITTTGLLYSWGLNNAGQLGSGDTNNRSAPIQVLAGSWTKVSAGNSFSMAIRLDGGLFTWGKNDVYQLGTGTTVPRSVATQVGTSSWTQIAAGDSHSMALRLDTGMFTWGLNTSGQTGGGNTTLRSNPTQVGTSSWTSIGAGNSYGVAIRLDGNLQTWGINNNGQLGAGTTTGRSAPAAVGTLSWTNVSAGPNSTIGTTTSNLTYVWGTNTNGQLGLNDTANRSSPTQLGSNLATAMYQTLYTSPVLINTGSIASWNFIGAGDTFVVGADTTGRLYAWGNNSTGQLGDGSTINTTPTKSSPSQIATTAGSFTFVNASSPVQIAAGTSWSKISAGGTHVAAIKSDGTLYTWGVNISGQLGNGTTLNQNTPLQIDSTNNYTNISSGFDYSLATRNNSLLYAWGLNSSGQLGDGTTVSKSSPVQVGSSSYSVISAGASTAYGIGTDSTLYGWGASASGQLLLGNTPPTGYYSVQFNGTNNYLRIPHSSISFDLGSSDFTIEAWVYPTSTAGYCIIASQWNSNGTNGWIFYWSRAGLGFPRFESSAGTTTSTTPITLNVWTHIAFTRVGSGTNAGTIYMNGVSITGGTFTGSITSTSDLLIGAHNNGVLTGGAGYTSNLRLVVGTALYTGGFTPTTSPLTLTSQGATASQVMLLTNQSIKFVDNSYNNLPITQVSSPVIVTTPMPFTAPAAGTSISTPTTLTTSSFTNVSAGAGYVMTLDSNNLLYAWGANDVGQLGDNTVISRSSPVQIGSNFKWSIIGTGVSGTPIQAGSLFVTGLNTSGQLGLSDSANRSSPTQIGALNQPMFVLPTRIGTNSWNAVAAGGSHSVAIADNYTLYSWGKNDVGQLGDVSLITRSSPVQISTSSWSQIAAGKDHTGGIRIDNTLWLWGLNNRGQIGDSTTVNKSTLTQTPGYWNDVELGASHTVALAENNTLYVWGDDNYGQ